MEKILVKKVGDKAYYKVPITLDWWGKVFVIVEGKPPCKTTDKIKKIHNSAKDYLTKSVTLFTEDKSVEYRARAIHNMLKTAIHSKQAEILASHEHRYKQLKTNNFIV